MGAMLVIEATAHWLVKTPSDHDRFLWIPKDSHWSYNGDAEAPTFSPSVRCTHDAYPDDNIPAYCQHVIITGGQCQFCDDCTHSLAGQTLPLLPFTDEEVQAYQVTGS